MEEEGSAILKELVLIRKELQAIRKALEPDNKFFMIRGPYSSCYKLVEAKAGLDGSFEAR